MSSVEAVAELEHCALSVVEGVEAVRQGRCPGDALRGVLGERQLCIGQEVPELVVVLVSDRRLQRDRGLRAPQDRFDFFRREVQIGGDLGRCGVAVQLCSQDPLGVADLVQPLDLVYRQADRPGLVCQRSGYRLPDPPGGVGGELEPAAVVELLDCPHQPDRPFLDQVEERQAPVAVPLGDRHHQTQVCLDHLLIRATIAALDPLGQLHLLRRRQQADLGDVLQEELQRVELDRPGRFDSHQPTLPWTVSASVLLTLPLRGARASACRPHRTRVQPGRDGAGSGRTA